MKLIIDIHEDQYEFIKQGMSIKRVMEYPALMEAICEYIANSTLIPDNPKNGKEVLIKYCLEHSGEEIYDLLKQIFDASMNWTDSRGFVIEWLESKDKK